MDRDAPATKGDVEDLRTDLRTEMQAMEDRLIERIQDTETKLLKAFYTFAESNQARLASIETEGDSMRKRITILESRMTEVAAEHAARRLSPGPAQILQKN